MMRSVVLGAALGLSLVSLGAPVMANASEPGANAELVVEACLDARQGGDRLGCVGVAASLCQYEGGGSSTAGVAMCLNAEAEVWDKRLNKAYSDLIAKVASSDEELKGLLASFIEGEPLLRQMQRNWIAFRDAACEFERSTWGGGTGAGPASTACVMQLTAEQYFRLQDHLGE